jgi:arylsulfatase A-like enzyme
VKCGLISIVLIVQTIAQSKPNVLFIAVDDLRPQLGCYGDTIVKSPNIDRLAARGLVFNRAYVQQALCAPSRASFLTGLRPDTTGVTDIETHFRANLPNVVTLPQLFKNNGYTSQGLYKIYHLAGFDPGFANLDDPPSWSAPLWLPTTSVYGPEGAKMLQRSYEELRAAGKPINYQNIPRSLAFEAPEVPDSEISEGETADEAIRQLRKLKDQPFFLAVGFYKPHLPFVAPKKYWDLYRAESLPLPSNQFAPRDAPALAMVNLSELQTYTNIPKNAPLSELLKRQLLHGYLACISYTDAQIGRVLDELERLRLRDKTIVVLLGDHGFQIGEHDLWARKHTNFETSVRAPLIISAPEMKARGKKTNALVEFVDIYPTLAELCGLKPPANLEGVSLKPLLNDARRTWKRAAFSQYPRGKTMGRSLRTDRHRFTEWREGEKVVAVELYDHQRDPQENENVAARPENKALVAQLSAQLRVGWRAALPEKQR